MAKKYVRVPLLIQKENMERVWKNCLPVSLFLAGLWLLTGRDYPYLGYIPGIPNPYDLLAIVAAPIFFLIALFAWFGSRMAYLQARDDHIRVVTPLYRFKISYRRIRSIHPFNFGEFSMKQKMSGLQRRSLRKYASKTAVLLQLNGYPAPAGLLRLFLGPVIMSSKSPGIALLVEDWMGFSTGLDSLNGSWRDGQSQKRQAGTEYNILQSFRK